MQIVRSTNYRRMPWKNGGGETREIVASPANATLDSMDWRVSLATVASDGPFSVFKGVQRTLCVIRGAGIQLQTGDRAPVDLHVTSDPYTFDGETATSACLLDGSIEDLNVMTRRGRYRHDAHRLVFNDTLLLDTQAQTLIAYCVRGGLQFGGETLQPDDTAIFDRTVAPIRVAATQTTEIIVVEITSE
jgi:uncharacterized protein